MGLDILITEIRPFCDYITLEDFSLSVCNQRKNRTCSKSSSMLREEIALKMGMYRSKCGVEGLLSCFLISLQKS